MPRHPKKSKYKSVVIKKKRYYFYKITWLDITGDSGHADLHTASGFMPSIMVTHAYLLNNPHVVRTKDKTFLTEEERDEKKFGIDVLMTPWIILSSDKKIIIPVDSVITIVEPIEGVKKMFLDKNQNVKIEENLNG